MHVCIYVSQHACMHANRSCGGNGYGFHCMAHPPGAMPARSRATSCLPFAKEMYIYDRMAAILSHRANAPGGLWAR